MSHLNFFKRYQQKAWENLPFLGHQIYLLNEKLKILIARRQDIEKNIDWALADRSMALWYCPFYLNEIDVYQQELSTYWRLFDMKEGLQSDMIYLEKKIEYHQLIEEQKKYQPFMTELNQERRDVKASLVKLKSRRPNIDLQTDHLILYVSFLDEINELRQALIGLQFQFQVLQQRTLALSELLLWREEFLQRLQKIKELELACQSFTQGSLGRNFKKMQFNGYLQLQQAEQIMFKSGAGVFNHKYAKRLPKLILKQEGSLKKVYRQVSHHVSEMKKTKAFLELSERLKTLKTEQESSIEKHLITNFKLEQLRTQLSAMRLNKLEFLAADLPEMLSMLEHKKQQFHDFSEKEQVFLAQLGQRHHALVLEILSNAPEELLDENLARIQKELNQLQEKYEAINSMKALAYQQCENELVFYQGIYQQFGCIFASLSFLMMCVYMEGQLFCVMLMMISFTAVTIMAFAKLLHAYHLQCELSHAYQAGPEVKKA